MSLLFADFQFLYPSVPTSAPGAALLRREPLLGSATPSSAASLTTAPSEYVLDLSCPVQEASASRGNLNIQFYYVSNDQFPKCDDCIMVISRLLLCLGYT